MESTATEKTKVARTSLLSKPLGLWVRFVIKCRYLVLFLSVAAAVWAGLYAKDNLKYKSKRLDLINPKSEWNQYWLDYIAKFGSTDDVVIAVDGTDSNAILAAVNEVAAEVQKRDDLYESLFYRVDDSKLVSKALHYASQDELQGLLMFLKNNEGVFHNHWETLSIDRLLRQSTEPLLAPAGSFPKIVTTQCEQTIERLITSLEGVFSQEYHYVSPFPEVDLAQQRERTTTDPQGMRPTAKETSKLFSPIAFPGSQPAKESKETPVEGCLTVSVPKESRPNTSLFSGLCPTGSYMARYPDVPTDGVPATPNAISPMALENWTVQDAGMPNSGKERHGNLHYFWAIPEKTAVLMLKIKDNGKAEFATGTAEITTLREILAKTEKNHPETKLALTGLPIMENDEMRSSQDAMGIATWLSILGVTLLYMIFFRGLRHPMMAVFALFVGIGWSMAFITLGVGHLNILSISFAVILVGLGIDFGIHYTSCYLERRRKGEDTYTALTQGAEQIGPGIFTGAMTTAAAFFMASFTEFTGVAELGTIAGGGIVLCCLAAFTVLPIFIYTSDKRRPVEKLPVPKDPNEGLAIFQYHPGVTLLVGAVIIGVCAFGLKGLYFDHNLLNLQAEGEESVELEMRLMEESNQSVWFALSMSQDREVLLKRMEAFNKLESVERVEQILTLMPEEDAQRTATIGQIHQMLAKTPMEAGMAPVLSLREMEACFTTITTYLENKSEYGTYRDRLTQLRKNFHAMTSPMYFERMQEYQTCLGEDLLEKFRALQAISSPEATTLADLPKPLVDRFMAPDGTYLLKVYGKGDLWNMENLSQFVKDVRSVDPEATGNPLQTYECSLQMKSCYEEAAWYALAMVVFLLYLDLRSIRHTLLALSPVVLGMICTFGIMGWLDIPLNAANMIVLPLILGIGIDDGVHVIHDFRHQHHQNHYRLSGSISMSVILTSLTTVIGFGTLMIAEHRGLQSLGLVLSLGVICCCVTSLLLLPALLCIFCRFAEEGRKTEVSPQEPSHEMTPVPNPAERSGESLVSSMASKPNVPSEASDVSAMLHIRRYSATANGEITQSTVRAA